MIKCKCGFATNNQDDFYDHQEYMVRIHDREPHYETNTLPEITGG